MIFRWLRNRRRKKILARPFPEEWREYLHEHVRFYRFLDAGERQRLEGTARVLMAEKNWEGCGGLALQDEMKLNVSAQAALLILNLEHDYYRGVLSVLIYPSTFKVPERYAAHGGVYGGVVERDIPALGLAHHRGPVVLTWDAARRGAFNPTDGRNVVFHEFAHKLDLLDDYADGTPLLEGREDYRLWVRILAEEYERLVRRTKAGRPTLLDGYGAEDPAEFFAVATECFFEKPVPMRHRHEELYGLLREYYRQDPAARREGRAAR